MITGDLFGSDIRKSNWIKKLFKKNLFLEKLNQLELILFFNKFV